jgi:hypothetical protein
MIFNQHTISSTKTQWLLRRIKFGLRQTPLRFWRLISVWWHPFYRRETPSVKLQAAFFLLGDLLFWWDVYEIVTNLFRRNVRLLSDIEIEIGKEVFQQNIDLQLVMLDNQSYLIRRGMAFAYVSLNTINYLKPMPADVFVHELVHVWQYQHFGAGYIATALAAQKTEAGYNYTFTEGWFEASSLLEFNPEQQADIIQDAYRLRMGKQAQWAARSEHLNTFLVDLEVKKPRKSENQA